MQTEVGPSETYRIGTIHTLKHFAEYHKPKTFYKIARQDVVGFLDSFRKLEQVDPLHKWIGTYEFYRIILYRFFRWLYAPDIPQKQRSRPAVMENIPKLKRKEVSIYKPTDLWIYGLMKTTLSFTSIVLRLEIGAGTLWPDTGCRPHELLKLKIKDVVAQQLDGGYQIAKILVNGKRGTRTVRINNGRERDTAVTP